MCGRWTERIAIAMAAGALAAAPARAQYREYYIRGKVVDAAQQPIAGVEIRLRDVDTSRDYDLTTDKRGEFKLAGLPHGVYEVHFSREGYAPKQDEWRFESPQETMQKVELPDVVLVSQAQVQEMQRSKEAEAGVKQAAEKLRAGDPEAAAALLAPVLAGNPCDANAQFLLGLSFVRRRNCREAVEPLTRVTELNPAFAPAFFELGNCRRQLGELEPALQAYEKSFELDPSNVDAAYNAGLTLFESGRVDEALARFQRGLVLKPGDADLLEMAGRSYVHQGKFRDAVEYLERARTATADPDKAAFLAGMIAKLRAQLQ
jgi:tetratricopeptide (TPR) repeat protein